ncbi:hypothetical protein F4821DRAFT_159472 [Hypoxylon rubiginosum]|uniref:Uncharacterized protein n=1 Tax=Hypoxylon rubiginosum TaxID=110542 RepID=A0ACC0DHC6_9PEZI|nr:hypothetical protein F4821DRAFT_159472 [Hypoxylon rubiginosum]
MAAKYAPLDNDELSQERGFYPGAESNPALEKRNKWYWGSPRSLVVVFAFILLSAVVLGYQILGGGWGKRKSPIPFIPTETVVFGNNSHFNSPPTPENDAMWMDLLGPGMGFVAIQNPSQYGLPPGISDEHNPPDVEVFGISMFHQLHCLMIIRDVFWANAGSKEADEEEVHHVNHCFDYIRQGIMCAGDMSIEGAAKMREGDTHVDRVNGYGSSHQCKNYQSSRDWMDKHLPGQLNKGSGMGHGHAGHGAHGRK